MPFSQSDLDAINKAITNNVTEVKFQNRTVTYRSMQELIEARNLIIADMGSSSGAPVIRQSRVVTHKGW
jgi:hypothetical protein